MSSSEPDQAAFNRARRSALFRAAHKRLDPIPRPLGLKRSALQMQKHRRASLGWHVGLLSTTDKPGACILISANGMTAFAVSETPTALVVEKRYCPNDGTRISQLMTFESAATFDRWCDIEPTRFDDPLLSDQLRRRGHEFFAAHD